MVASSNISTFRSNFKGGSRPNRFEVSGKIPTSTPQDIDNSNTFLIKASTMPPSTIGIIPVPYRGRILKVPGDRLFIEWDIVIIDDPGNGAEGSDLRNKFVEWSHLINKHAENTLNNQNYYADWSIYQLESGADKALKNRKITLHNCWPVEISGIEFNHDIPNTLVQWNVRMAYDFWTTDAPSGPRP
jgi:hypothetical protein